MRSCNCVRWDRKQNINNERNINSISESPWKMLLEYKLTVLKKYARNFNDIRRTFSQEIINPPSSTIAWKKDTLSVYNINTAYPAS